MTEAQQIEPRMWGVTRVASELGVHEATVYRWCKEKRLPYVRMPGGHLRFDPAKITSWLEDRAVEVVK